MNYPWIIFPAKGAEAMLATSAWADSKKPGGRELMMNFVEIQPYNGALLLAAGTFTGD